jgi:hypothetical protein
MLPAQPVARLRYDGSAAQTLTRGTHFCEPRASDLRAPVRSACAGRPPRSTRCSRAVPANRTPAVSSSLAQAESTRAIGTVGRSSCSRGPTTQGLGLASLGAPRRATELGDTRGAFHRSATCDIRPGFRPARCDRQGRIHSFSPACGEYTAPFSTLAVTATLTSLRQRERGLLCDRDGPKS